jgi:transposase
VKTLSLDLRERILTAYDQEEGNREEVAHRFRVSLGMVKKLLQQRKHTGDIAPRHHHSGRKPLIVARHQAQLRVLLDKQPDRTLKELRTAIGLKCSLPAIHYVLQKLELTYKKRHCTPASKAGRTSRSPGGSGGEGSPPSIRRGWSSSMKRVPRPT